jgi:uridine kinase
MPKQYYKANRRKFIEYVFGHHKPSQSPVAVFMAGTPGSGKTEVAESLSAIMTKSAPVILDADR